MLEADPLLAEPPGKPEGQFSPFSGRTRGREPRQLEEKLQGPRRPGGSVLSVLSQKLQARCLKTFESTEELFINI